MKNYIKYCIFILLLGFNLVVTPLAYSSNDHNINDQEMKEIFKDIPQYEGLYQVSNLANVKGVKRNKLLKPALKKNGYLQVVLSKNNKAKTFSVHTLVAYAFLNHNSENGLEVDHKDNNKLNNNLDNLQLITHRENNTKDKYRKNPKSKYIGVAWKPKLNKWQASIGIKYKKVYLGVYDNEYEAHLAYQSKLIELTTTGQITETI